jgi:hypothetical protein
MTLGSHILHGGLYVPLTGSSYSGNTSAPGGLAYFLVHPSGGSATGYTSVANDGVGPQWVEIVRDGGAWLTSSSAGSQVRSTNTTNWSPTTIGRENNAGWKMDGRVVDLRRFNAPLTTSEMATLEAGCP